MIVKLTVTFKSARGDKDIFLNVTHKADALGIVKGKAMEIINNGLYYKEGATNYFVSPSDIYSVTWED